MAAGGSRRTALALFLTMLITSSCGTGMVSSDPIEAGDEDEVVVTPEDTEVQLEDLYNFAVDNVGNFCELFKLGTTVGSPSLTEYIENEFDDGHEILEHRVDFDDLLVVGPYCLWEQKLNRFVRNQVSIIVMPLEEFDVVRGQGGQAVDVSLVAPGLCPQPSLEVYFDPTDDPPASIPDDNGLRVWHRGEVNLFFRREAGAPGCGEIELPVPLRFPGVGRRPTASRPRSRRQRPPRPAPSGHAEPAHGTRPYDASSAQRPTFPSPWHSWPHSHEHSEGSACATRPWSASDVSPIGSKFLPQAANRPRR